LTSQTQPARRRVTIERSFNAPIDEVWELWTTKDGIESWWGPPGFEVKVRTLDVRRGGELLYAMTAVASDQIDFLKKAGMALTTDSVVTYTEVVPRQRLAFTQMADFIPNVKPYAVATTVEFDTNQQGVRLVLTLDAMHDEYWTKMAVMGWEQELGKLADLLKRA
jgi:uncharacterized protein YndB with AHSA1/START domain